MLMSIECETTNHCGRRRRQRRRQRRRWKINRVQTKKPFQKLETRQVPQKTDSGVRLDRREGTKNNNFPHWRGCGDDTRAPRLRLSSHFLLSR